MPSHRASSLVLCTAALLTVTSCAEGYGADGIMRSGSGLAADAGAQALPIGRGNDDAAISDEVERDAGAPKAGDDHHWPCDMGEISACRCADTGAMGESMCEYSATSPRDGYFGECGGCDALPDAGKSTLDASPKSADAGEGCLDGTKNGFETDIDCGGRDCAKCADGQLCVAHSDCTNGNCVGSVCTAVTTVPQPSGFACGGVACPSCPETAQCCDNDASCGCLGPAGLICRN